MPKTYEFRNIPAFEFTGDFSLEIPPSAEFLDWRVTININQTKHKFRGVCHIIAPKDEKTKKRQFKVFAINNYTGYEDKIELPPNTTPRFQHKFTEGSLNWYILEIVPEKV